METVYNNDFVFNSLSNPILRILMRLINSLSKLILLLRFVLHLFNYNIRKLLFV